PTLFRSLHGWAVFHGSPERLFGYVGHHYARTESDTQGPRGPSRWIIWPSRECNPKVEKAKIGMPKDNNRTSEPKLGYPGGLATKCAADVRAQTLQSTIREIHAAGFVRLKDITDEL